MKTGLKQKHSTLQTLINDLEAGGGGTVDAYTKAEADAKFETKTDAASTYLSKSDAASTYQAKADMANYLEEETGGYFVVNGIRIYVSATEPTGTIPEGSIGLGW